MRCVLNIQSCSIIGGCPIAAYASGNNPTFYPQAGSIIARPLTMRAYEGDLGLLARGSLPLRGYLFGTACGTDIFKLHPQGLAKLICGKPNLYIPDAPHQGTLQLDESRVPEPIESIFVVDHFISMAMEMGFDHTWKFTARDDHRWLHDERIGLHNRTGAPLEIMRRGCALLVGSVFVPPGTPQNR